MTSLRLAGLVSASDAPLLIASHRRAAAVIGLLFPLLVAGILIAALPKVISNPTSLLTHPLLLISLPGGCWATAYWIRRYWRPAYYALRSRAAPVVVTDSELLFFGNSYPLTTSAALEAKNGKIRFIDGPSVVAERPLFFIKSEPLQINLHNLGNPTSA